MKKTLLLTLALGLAAASSLLAANSVDVYITGSTAFRQTSITACTETLQRLHPPISTTATRPMAVPIQDLSVPAPLRWTMTGNPDHGLTTLNGVNTLNIHGLFTGSIQGIQTTEQSTKLVWAAAAGTAGGLCSSVDSDEQPHHRLFGCVRRFQSLPGHGQLC